MLRISENFSLKKHNTFGIEARARYFIEISQPGEISEFLQNDRLKHLPLFILGGGSNVLLTKDFNGVVLKINIPGKAIQKEDENFVYLKAGAGENWHNLVLFCLEKNWGGAENLSLIPGSVGAAPMQNIGAYGTEFKDVFFELEAVMTDSGKIKKFSKEECHFGYRESVFKNELKGKCIIVSVTLKLKKEPVLNTSYGAIEQELKVMNVTSPGIKDVSEAVCRIRKSKLPDPAEIGNAGSFFKNPIVPKEKYETLKARFEGLVAYPSPPTPLHKEGESWKLAAGWLIENAGWKGKRIGDCGVHRNQALVLVNYGNASGDDLLNLSQKIIEDIKEKYDVELEREVNVV